MNGPATSARPRLGPALLLLGALLVGSILLAASTGAGAVALRDVFGAGADPMAAKIFWQVRLPRVLLAAVLGGALSVAGIVFQALLRNPLADPYVLGVSAGASVGGTAALLLGLGGSAGLLAGLGAPAFAFLGALAALVLVERLATIDGHLAVPTLLLVGVIVNATAGAAILFLQSVASLEELHAVVYFLMGQVPSLGLGRVSLLAGGVLAASALLLVFARDYNALSLGEETALQLGVEVERVKRRTFLAGSLLTALAVSTAGMIGFVGLIVPHALRLLVGPDHRRLLPAGLLAGGTLLVLADLGARLVARPTELPVGVLTALLGGPFFLYLLRARRRGYGGG